jgi:hypothetical protein
MLRRRERPARPPGTYAVVTVEDPTGRFEDYYSFNRETVERGLSIGSDRACHIRLTGLGVRPLHARLDPMSNHWILRYLAAGARLPLSEADAGEFNRVDRVPFEIEGYTLLIDDD